MFVDSLVKTLFLLIAFGIPNCEIFHVNWWPNHRVAPSFSLEDGLPVDGSVVNKHG